MNDDLVPDGFIKDEIRIGRRWQAADRGIVSSRSNERIIRQELNECAIERAARRSESETRRC
jgi:hypothetical protein